MKCAEPNKINKLNNVKLSPELLNLKSVIDKSNNININLKSVINKLNNENKLNNISKLSINKSNNININKLNMNKLWLIIKNNVDKRFLSTLYLMIKNNNNLSNLLNTEPTVESVEMKQYSSNKDSNKDANKDSNKNSYIIIIRYSNNVIKHIELNEREEFILKTAILYNRGFINLLNPSRRKTINNLFNKGLVTIESSTLNHCEGLVKVVECVRGVLGG